MLSEIFDVIPIGQSICEVASMMQHPVPGQCNRYGAVIDKVRNDRAAFLVVLFNDGKQDYVGGITDMGIGHHLYPKRG